MSPPNQMLLDYMQESDDFEYNEKIWNQADEVSMYSGMTDKESFFEIYTSMLHSHNRKAESELTDLLGDVNFTNSERVPRNLRRSKPPKIRNFKHNAKTALKKTSKQMRHDEYMKRRREHGEVSTDNITEQLADMHTEQDKKVDELASVMNKL